MARKRKPRPAGNGAAPANSPAVAPKPGADEAQTLRIPKGSDQDLLAQAKSDFDRGWENHRENAEEAYRDLAFYDGSYNAQWPAEAVAMRLADNRPILTFNQLPPRVRQVTGDIRQLRPAIKAVPVDDQGDIETAEVVSGIIRYVENRSNAQNVYFRAADSQVACGIGAWMVTREYANPQTFNQELRIQLIKDAVAIVWDPDSIEITREDANWVHVPVDMSRAVFKREYPNASPAPLDSTTPAPVGWYTADTVRVSQYWWKERAKKTLAMGPDGKVMDLTDKPDEIKAAKAQGWRVEQRDGIKIRVLKMTANEILEGPTDWPGSFIPIVPLIGEEIVIGKKTVRKGIVRNAKDPQRAYNYFRSTQAEVIGLQPKAPFIGTDENFKAFEEEWNSANTKAYPFLRYTPDKENNGGPPTRSTPAVSNQGVSEAVMLASEDLKSVTGIYDASLGAKSNETSGRAISARQREGDVGSFVYISNFGFAVMHTGRIICDLMRYVYDTARTLRIIGEDGKVDVIKINQPVGPAFDGVAQLQNDITTGAYDVVMEMGPSYSTKREEAKDGMTALAQAAPEIASAIADLFVKAQDWPMADKIAKRLQRNLPMPIRIAEAQEAGDEKALQEIAQEQQLQTQLAQNAPPPPEVLKAQAEAERSKSDAERDAIALQIRQIDRDIAEINRATAEANALAKVAGLGIGESSGAAASGSPATAAAGEATPPGEPAAAGPDIAPRMEALESAMEVLTTIIGEDREQAGEPTQNIAQALAELHSTMRAMNAPKRIVRNESGQLLGVESEPVEEQEPGEGPPPSIGDMLNMIRGEVAKMKAPKRIVRDKTNRIERLETTEG